MANMRISGLSSGLDMDSIVQQLMSIERMPINRLNTKKTDFRADQKAWQDINSSLLSLQMKISDLKLDSTFNVKTAVSSNKEIVTATATTNAAVGTYEIHVQTLAKAHRVSSDQQADSTSSLGFTGSFTINGEAITIDGTNNSLSGIRDAINAVDGLGVNATIIDNTLVVTANETGVSNSITTTDADGILASLGILDGMGSFKNERVAEDAKVTVNGITITQATNKVEGVIDNLTLDLKDLGTATVEITNDTQSTVDKVKAFVEQFNKTHSLMRTNSRKDQVTEKVGTLYGDFTLVTIENSLRDTMTSLIPTGNDIKALSMIGVAFDKEGNLTLNEAKLKESLETSPDEVTKLFTATQADDGFDGFATKMDSWLDTHLQFGGIVSKKEGYYNDLIRDIDDQIDNMELRLDIKEKNLYRQFTELEKMLGQMDSQSQWLSTQLAGLSFNK